MITKSLRWAWALSLLWACPALAQTAIETVERQRVTDRIVIGDTIFDQVLKVVGLPSVSGGASSALGVDSSGNVRKDAGTTISTGGLWTFGTGVNFPFVMRGTTASLTALGYDNIRTHSNVGFPTLTFEDAGSNQWGMDNFAGTLRLYQTDGPGFAIQIPFLFDGNINVAPYGKYMLPSNPYGFSLGSPGKPLDAIWAGSLFIQTLVASETLATINGRQLIGKANILDADVLPSATTITVRYNNILNNDYLVFEKDGKKEAMKATSSATAVNLVANNNFETNLTGWFATDTPSQSTAKSFRGNASMLQVHNGTSGMQFTTTATFTAGNPYTLCGYLRRSDGVALAPGDVQAYVGGASSLTDMTAEATGTDSWYRACATVTAGSSDVFVLFNMKADGIVDMHDWYLDAVQLEAGSTVRPWSETRSSYTVTRNLDSTVANQWFSGDSLFDAGNAVGYGWLDCYAFFGLKSASEIGPSCVANVRTSTTNWNDWAPRAAWGQLNGLYGYSTSTFGFAAGDPSGTHVDLTDSNGMRIMNGATTLTQWDASGNGSLTGSLSIGTSGNLRSGATSFSAGTGYWLAYNGGTPQMRVGNPSGDRLAWDGTNIDLHARNLSIDVNGIAITGSTSGAFDSLKSYRFEYGDAFPHGLSAIAQGVSQLTESRSGAVASVTILAQRPDVGGAANASFQVSSLTSGGITSRVTTSADQAVFSVNGLIMNGTAGATKTCTVLPTVVNGIVTSC